MVKIVDPSFEILSDIDYKKLLKHIEKIARTCYKSEDKISDDTSSAEKIIANLINLKHEAMIEHFNISVKIVTDRGISHELVRHRIASYAQESSRYANYSKDKFGNEITVIKPSQLIDRDDNCCITPAYQEWHNAMVQCEKSYLNMLQLGYKTDVVRSVLPTCTKTEINITTNLREWRHIFKLRCAKSAHPDIRLIMLKILEEFKRLMPLFFNDLVFE